MEPAAKSFSRWCGIIAVAQDSISSISSLSSFRQASVSEQGSDPMSLSGVNSCKESLQTVPFRTLWFHSSGLLSKSVEILDAYFAFNLFSVFNGRPRCFDFWIFLEWLRWLVILQLSELFNLDLFFGVMCPNFQVRKFGPLKRYCHPRLRMNTYGQRHRVQHIYHHDE